MKTLLLLTLFIPLHATACINVTGTALDGSSKHGSGYPASRVLEAILKQTPDERARELVQIRNHTGDDDFLEKEFEGVQEILKGNSPRAIVIFKQLETDHPGRYSTAANLGTAYELNGELENALTWIREGIKRNKDSHEGSEWLHVEILKARINLRADPDYLRRNHVVSLPDTYTRSSIIGIGDDTRSIDQIDDAIFYQLKERMLFVKPPDPVVADLLFTFGEIQARIATLEPAVGLLHLSAGYGFADPAVLTTATTQYERIILHRQIKRWSLITAGVLFGLFLLYRAWRNKTFFLTRRAQREHLAAAPARL